MSNKIQTAFDGKWRSLGGRPMHAAAVAPSEHHNAVLADRLTRTFGLDSEPGDGAGIGTSWEIADVPDELIAALSTRSHDVEIEADRLIALGTEQPSHPP